MSQLLIESLNAAHDYEVTPAFGRSETFHPRYGWLKKGFDAARRHPDIFIRDDATTLLGVGKNMVRAIRYWCLAYKVLEEYPDPERPRLRNARSTEFGERLLGEQGLDPFIEDVSSLWLLHWQLLRPPCLAPAWFAVFNGTRAREVSDESLLAVLRIFCDARAEWGSISESSLRRDARCLLRMYASVTTGRDLLEDSIDSPFSELDLLRPVLGSRRHYVFNSGRKLGLRDEIIAYASIDFLGLEHASSVTSLARLARATGSPGAAFRLGEEPLAEALTRVAEDTDLIAVTHAAGARQLVFDGDADAAKEALLARTFAPGGRRT